MMKDREVMMCDKYRAFIIIIIVLFPNIHWIDAIMIDMDVSLGF